MNCSKLLSTPRLSSPIQTPTSISLLSRPAQRLAIAATLAILGLAARHAVAATVITTVKGVVTSGTDVGGIFLKPGADLSGQSFTVTYITTDIHGSSTSCSTSSPNFGEGEAVLQIATGTYRFGFGDVIGNPGESVITRSSCNGPGTIAFSSESAYRPPQGYVSFINFSLAPAPGAPPLTDLNWEDPLNLQVVPLPGLSIHRRDTNTFNTGDFYDDTRPSGTSYGVLNPTSIVVSGPLPSLPAATFPTATLSPTGSSTSGGIAVQSATADFNGDGKLDLVTSNLTNASISILFGKGDGTFQPPVNYTVGPAPYGIVARDFNGDGKADIAVVSGASGNGPNTVSILLNDGKGRFPAQPTFLYPVQSLPYGLSTADLNNDGNLDLVVSNTGANTVSVLLGKGDGSFQPQVPYSVGATSFQSALADLDGDGFNDIVTANLADNTLSVLLNDRTGKFLPGSTYPTGNAPFSLVARDFNGDGHPDVAVTNAGDGTIGILYNDGFGLLTNGQASQTYPVGASPTSIVAADLNGDGVLDLSVANLAGNTVSVLLGTVSADFSPQPTTPTAAQPYFLTVADFNNDGKPDLAVSFYEYYTGVLLQKP